MWFLGIMGAIFVLLFIGICFVDRIITKEKNDPVYKAKMEQKRQRWKKYEPIEKAVYNVFWWAAALLFFYYIYLGWEGL